ncbi:MAG: hypothetical protein KF767_18305 [Bdellovibrionaceae bacterium]|nr:hypothetical protein [Pseudobdellovibrionaceae bacterium]
MTTSPLLRRYLLVDACFALAGGLLYVFLFNFLITTLGLPEELARFQLTANWVYAGMGFFFFFRRPEQTARALALIARMNLAYSGVCGLAGVWLLATTRPWGTALLFAEGLGIAGLALMERRALAREMP